MLPSHRVPQQCLMHSMSSLGQDLLLLSSLQVEGRLAVPMVLLVPLSAFTSRIASRRPSHGLGCVLGCIHNAINMREILLDACDIVAGTGLRMETLEAMDNGELPVPHRTVLQK